jgi:hypothetical protein
MFSHSISISDIEKCLIDKGFIDKVKIAKISRLLLLSDAVYDAEVLNISNMSSAISKGRYLKVYKAIYDYLVSKA